MKKVGPPFSEDSPETQKILKAVFYSSIKISYYNLEMKYVPFSLEAFLIHKTWILSNGDFLLFKEGIPSIQLIKNYIVYLSPILSQIDFLNQNRMS